MLSPTIAVLLAAGAGSRFDGGGHKLDAELDGATVADHAVRAAVAAGIGPVIVVTGAVEPALSATHFDRAVDVTLVANPDWAAGQSTSLQVAVDAAQTRHAHAIVVGLADQPFVDPTAWRSVAASRSPIAVAEYDGRPRNPVRLHHSVWPLLPTVGDHGARHLIRLRPELVERVPCQGSDADIDTLEDLRSWQNRSSTNSP
ncbi:molybdenum cofactor cytidylyltransferase/nicotine blue oxidoreductase [Ilumatobacter fluminis]|uniref:Molybdenum cofactor cytidylyltransferase/nicotine blue oxidoreductase n=1 Tax=Ilumatobacter fluminis TaxID=467091 RepID=A0A4R7HYH0_9ACTN|nr:nucleotidyltransferase family protein [Ilumatobacter fluminis]TDT15559.1 molybdenum cofactor cytidylyltransferase/nicotine blue oxidoreductase [Ilumatobacter fluminis]